MKEQTKLSLKEFTNGEAKSSKAINSLDEVKNSGNYILICKNATTADGLPQIHGKGHSCYCCDAHLIVTACYSENESQSETSYGQCLTICDRKTGVTNTYTRTISPTKNNGKWSSWQMVATGNIELVSQSNDVYEAITQISNNIDSRISRESEFSYNLSRYTQFSKNLFDVNSTGVQKNKKYLDDYGNITESTNTDLTHFIAVEPNTEYYIPVNSSTNIHCYDINFKHIGVVGHTNDVYTMPEGTRWIRFFYYNGWTGVRVIKGNTDAPYPYNFGPIEGEKIADNAITIEKLNKEVIATINSETEKRINEDIKPQLAQQVKSLSAIMPVGKNYINPNGDLLHDRLVSGGSFVTMKGAIATDKLFLEKGVVYTTSGFTAYGSSLRMIAIMYFDENNNYIGRTNVGHLGASDEENPNYVSNFIYSPVDGTAYCRITLCGADGNIDFAKAQLEKGSFATSFEEFKGWRYAKDDSYAKEKTSELARNAIQMPRGKNYINKDDLYYGYSTSQGQYVKSPMSVQSNKLFLQPGVVYTIKGVDSFGSDIDQLFLILFDKNDNYIGRKQFDLKEGRLCTFTYPQTEAAYSRILLYNYSQGQKQATDIEIVQLEKGDTATEFEVYAGTDYIAYSNTSDIGNILLTGASFADKNFNQWFEIMCMELGVRGYNKGLSGSSIHDTAQKMHDGTLYTKAELEDFEVLMIMHVHNNNVADTTGLIADHKNYTFPAAGNLSYAQAFDYVLKKYAADCYALKDDTTSKWYGQKMGKPCKVVCLTHWHDSRSIYNEAIRTLRDKWGFTLVELDKNIGFSKNQPHPITAEQTSIMYAVDTEVIDGVTYGWHPSREFVNNEPPIIQKHIAEIVKKKLISL